MFDIKLNLQLFAEAGTLVNATTSYVNAYDGTSQAFDGVNTLAGELKVFYDTELLENARVEMFYAQFAKKQHLPANHGTTVEWRKWNTFAKAGQLQEGVIPTGQKFGMSSKTGAINQYGTYATISDKLELRAYDDVILGATEEMGASAAETQETLIRDALLVNTNVLYCDNLTLADNTVASTSTAPNAMEAAATVMSLLTPDMVAKAVTKMKKDASPPSTANTTPSSIPPLLTTCARARNGSRPTSIPLPAKSSTAKSASCTAFASSRTSSLPSWAATTRTRQAALPTLPTSLARTLSASSIPKAALWK